MWYVIWTETGKEDRFVALMERYFKHRILRCVVPKKAMDKKIRGEWKRVETRLFPSYVFVETDEVDLFDVELKGFTWYAGFNNLLKNEDSYAPLKSRDEELIKKLSGFDAVIQPSVGYEEGDRIIVTEGPLKGLEGCIKQINRHKREALMEVELFKGNPTIMKLGLEVVEKRGAGKREPGN